MKLLRRICSRACKAQAGPGVVLSSLHISKLTCIACAGPNPRDDDAILRSSTVFRPWGRCRRSSFSVTLTTCTTRDMLGTNRQGCYGISSVACSQAAQQPQHWRITLTSWFKRHQVGHRDFQPYGWLPHSRISYRHIIHPCPAKLGGQL